MINTVDIVIISSSVVVGFFLGRVLSEQPPVVFVSAKTEVQVGSRERRGDFSGFTRLTRSFRNSIPQALSGFEDTMPLDIFDSVSRLSGDQLRNQLDAAIQQVPRDRHSEQMGRFLLSRWLELDPKHCLSWILEHHMPFNSKGLLKPLFHHMALGDPEETVDALSGLRMRDHRELAISGVLSSIGEADPASALSLCDQLGKAGESAKASIIERWASTDLIAAGKFALNRENLEDRAELLSRVAKGAAAFPSNGLDWAADNLTNNREKENFILNLTSNLRKVDDLFLAMAERHLPEGAQRNQLYAVFAGKMAQEDAEMALEWAASLSTSPAVIAAQSAIAAAIARSDPKLAQDLLASLPGRQAEEEYFFNYVSTKMSGSQNLESIQGWISEISDKRKQAMALSSTLTILGTQDVSKATELLRSVRDRDDYQELASRTALSYGSVDATGAAGWLLSLPVSDATEPARVVLENYGNMLEDEIVIQLRDLVSPAK